MRLRRGYKGQPVNYALGAYLLEYSYSYIAQDNSHEKHVPVGSHQEHEHGNYHIYQVEQREYIIGKYPADAL